MFLVKNKKFQTIVLRGSAPDNGKKIGFALRKGIQQSLRRDRKLLDRVKNKNNSLVSFLSRKLAALFPDSVAELRGMALGAKVEFSDLFLENCPELLNKEDGCTSAAVHAKNSFFIIHNEDEAREKSGSGFALARYTDGGRVHEGFIYPGELAGNAFGWGADWFYCVNFLPVRKPDLKGVPRYFVARRLLEQKNISSALKFLRSAKEASGFHYLMGDISGRVVSVEKRHQDISIKPIEKRFCHSNHYIHPRFKNLETSKTGNSVTRLLIANKNISSNFDQQKIFKIWRNELRRPLNKEDDSKTFATVLADLKNKTIVIN